MALGREAQLTFSLIRRLLCVGQFFLDTGNNRMYARAEGRLPLAGAKSRGP
jgi:hypothetical protein